MGKIAPRPNSGILYRFCKQCNVQHEENGTLCKRCRILKRRAYHATRPKKPYVPNPIKHREYYQKNKERILMMASLWNGRKKIKSKVDRLLKHNAKRRYVIKYIREKLRLTN